MGVHATERPTNGLKPSARPSNGLTFSHPTRTSHARVLETADRQTSSNLTVSGSSGSERSPGLGHHFARLRVLPPAPPGPSAPCTCGGACDDCREQPSAGREGDLELEGAPATPASAPPARPQPPKVTQQPEEDFSLYLGRLRAGCLKDGSVTVSLEEGQNNSNQATGRLHVRFEGAGRTSYPADVNERRLLPVGQVQRAESGKFCFCDCLHYRQYLQGLVWVGPIGGIANQPVRQITSGLRTERVDGQWYEEDVSTGLNWNLQQVGCQREFTDTPGVTAGARAGLPVLLRYNFYLQIWDGCQQEELWHDQLALTIGGSTPPRTILWSWQTLPLSRASILADVAGGPIATAEPPGDVTTIAAPNVRLFDNPMDPLVELTSGTLIPVGTRVRILDDSDPVVHQVTIVDGPMAGQTGYISAIGSYRDNTEDQREE